MSLTIYYYFDDFTFFYYNCDEKNSIGSILEYINKKHESMETKFPQSAYLKGIKLNENDEIRKYIDELRYSAIFISDHPDKEIFFEISPINFDDYQINYLYNHNSLYIAENKKTHKKILIQYFYEDHEHFIQQVYMNYILKDANPAKILWFCFSLTEDEKKKLNENSNTIIIYDFYETETVISNLQKYTRLKYSNQIQMNPTIISKIIFGIAAIMKKVHQNNILLPDFDLDCFCFDENFEPHLFQLHDASNLQKDGSYNPSFLSSKIYKYFIIYELWFDNLYLPPELNESNHLSIYSDVFSYGILLYKIFSDIKLFDNNKKSDNPYLRIKYISQGARPVKTQNIPDHYWNLIQKCWAQEPLERPSFDEIVENLKNDKFAINEFEIKTDLDELHEYQQRIDS